MSFYSDASLALIPSGYKNGKVYSALPTDGSGDMSFTRASNATRVASNGLIEKVRTNIALYSEQFNDASWNKGTLTVSANAATAPNGTTTADLIYPSANSSNSVIFNGVTISNGVEYTNSVYAKASGKTWIFIRGIRDANGVWFNLSSGTIGTTEAGVSGTITSIGSGWYRCSVTQTSSSTTGRLVILVVDGDGSTSVTVNGTDGLLIWGGQQEADVMTDYIATTTAAVSVGPVSGLPRLDYLNSSCPRLLLEPQRTNLVTFSEQFDNAYFPKFNTAVNANVVTSPDGSTNADKLVATATTGVHYLRINVTSASPAVLSVFAKAGEETIFAIGNATGSGAVVFNLSTGTITSGTDGTIVNYGNGWYRCSYYRTSWSDFQYLSLRGNAPSYTGNGTDGIFLYGAQFEVGAYPTSYIPTLGTSVTRVADAAYKTGVSSLIGQTEGVIFIDFVASAQNQDGVTYSVITIFGDAADNFQLYTIGGAALRWFAFKAGGIIFDQLASQTLVAGQRYKIAYAYKSGDWALYINGVQKSTRTDASIPAVSQFNFNSDSFGASVAKVENKFNQVLLFKTRLSNEKLAEITSL
jgi:hypothetical protein